MLHTLDLADPEILGMGHHAIRGPIVRLAISFEVNGRAFAIRER